jgi:chromosome transmission fidelity protein 4
MAVTVPTIHKNSAHSPGLTCLTFSRDGTLAYTGGSDTLVRIWRTDQGPDQEPDTAVEAAEGVTCLAEGKDCWLSGSDDAEVRRYTKGKPELDGLVTSVVGVPVRSIAIDPQGSRVVVTSE